MVMNYCSLLFIDMSFKVNVSFGYIIFGFFVGLVDSLDRFVIKWKWWM